MDTTDSAPSLPAWPSAIARALLAIALILPAALLLNVLIGRTIHWDIVGVIAALAFVVLTIAYRYAR